MTAVRAHSPWRREHDALRAEPSSQRPTRSASTEMAALGRTTRIQGRMNVERLIRRNVPGRVDQAAMGRRDGGKPENARELGPLG